MRPLQNPEHGTKEITRYYMSTMSSDALSKISFSFLKTAEVTCWNYAKR